MSDTDKSTTHKGSKRGSGSRRPPDGTFARHADALARISAIAVASAEPDVALQRVLGETASVFDTHLASLCLYVGDHGLKHVTNVGLAPNLLQKVEALGRPDLMENHFASTARPFLIPDARQAPDGSIGYRPAVAEGLVTVVSAPLCRSDRRVGILTLYHEEAHTYSEADLTLLQTLANLAALTLTNAQIASVESDQDRAKDHFLGMLGHELRTPLTSIMGFTQIIRKKLANSHEIDARIMEHLDVIWSQEQRLNRLIGTLVDIARIDSGEFSIVRGKAELGTTLRGAVTRALSQVKTRHSIEMEIPAEPIWVDGDAARLEQVFSHIVSNALRYSPVEQPIRVVCEEHKEEHEVTVSISDQGPGIPASRQKELFEQFYPSEMSRAGGLGMGLYISRTIVEAHNGRISIDSSPSAGTTVHVVLPVTSYES
ncbi:MAG: GAF domain-containing sensor histidine kinase [Chloroflexi bacterium]|nr:GAF domain-containing sensor histidine kinase [Chloroflexota bacterium]